jgi:hypothetical protein
VEVVLPVPLRAVRERPEEHRFAKDVKALELSAPFNPVDQLMAVLPSDSAHALPEASRWLKLDEESPIIDFFPSQVPVDPNGKAMPWLCVVLLPFIDEERLISAMSSTMAQWKHEELAAVQLSRSRRRVPVRVQVPPAIAQAHVGAGRGQNGQGAQGTANRL